MEEIKEGVAFWATQLMDNEDFESNWTQCVGLIEDYT